MLFAAGLSSLLLASQVAAADHLVSRRHAKRFVDDNGNYNISIYHINDVHAHLDEFASAGTDCVAPEKGCFGGYARVKNIIEKTRPMHPDSLFLNAGDEFQGTLFFSYYGGEKIAQTLNQMGFDAMTIGNHEFDRGDDFLGGFLKNLTFPVVCANIDTPHPVLNKTIVPYHIFPKHKLALVAVTTETIPEISSPGKDTKFGDPVAVVQATVDHIKATEKDVNRFVVLTHIGYDEDKLLAQKTRGVHLIVGGHSHTLLGKDAGAEGAYPTIEKNLDGEEVFIVTAHRWGERLGYIDVAYDKDGRIVAYTGDAIHITNSTEQDAGLQKQVDEWRKPFDDFGKQVVGHSDSVLDQTTCKRSECVLGDVMSDAIVDYRSHAVDGAIINGGGVRATIDAGPVTRGEILTAFPFNNAVVERKFTGDELWKIFEGVFSQHSLFNDKPVIPTTQVSKEFRIKYNPDNANGSRLISLDIGGKPVDFEHTYTIATIDFVATGGDNQLPAVTASELVILDALDEVLLDYINKTSPIKAELDGRISTTTETKSQRDSSKGAAVALWGSVWAAALPALFAVLHLL